MPWVALHQRADFSIAGDVPTQPVFDDLKQPAPQVNIESVLQRDPEVILAGDQPQLDAWKAWPQVTAVAQKHLLLVPDKGLERPSGQMLEAVARLCEVLAPQR